MFIDHRHHSFLLAHSRATEHIALVTELTRFCFGWWFYKHCAATRLKELAI